MQASFQDSHLVETKKNQREKEERMTTETEMYPHVILTGTPFERGLKHGSILREKIQMLGNHYRTSDTLPPWDWCQNIIEWYYIPALEKYDPYAFEELKGIAKGSETSLDTIILINARYDLTKYRNNSDCADQIADNSKTADECTTGAIIDEKSVKLVQNWDLDSYVYDNDLCVVLETRTTPQEGLPKTIVTLGEVGQLGRSGMNSEGLGLCANGLNATIDFFNFPIDPRDEAATKRVEKEYGIKLPVIPVSFARRKFLSCHSFANGLKYIVQSPRHVSGNILVATAAGMALDFELIPNSYFLIEPTYVDEKSGAEVLPSSNKRAFITHSNHFLSPRYTPAANYMRCKNPGGSSLYRHHLLARNFVDIIKSKPIGKGISVDDVKKCVSDRTCAPNALSESINLRDEPQYCTEKDPELLLTVATAIYDLTNGTATFCKGPPHAAKKWLTVNIDIEKQ